MTAREPQVEPRVTVQENSHRPGRRARWGYVLHVPGYWPLVSKYRWGSEASARRAGEKDLAGLLDAIEERGQ